VPKKNTSPGNAAVRAEKLVTDAAVADFHDVALEALDLDADGALHAIAEDPLSYREFKLSVSGSAADPRLTCPEVNTEPPGADPFNNHRFGPPIGPVQILTRRSETTVTAGSSTLLARPQQRQTAAVMDRI
jgi:hypothetical protein